MSTPVLISFVALWAIVVFQGLVLLGLVRTVYQRQSANPASSVVTTDGALRGRDAPDFSAVDLNGVSVNSADFADKTRALLFVSPDCASCSVTLAELESLGSKVEGALIVICRAERDSCSRLAESYELVTSVIVDEDLAVSALFDVTAVPTAVLVGANNRIQSYGQPMRADELEEMIRNQENATVGGR